MVAVVVVTVEGCREELLDVCRLLYKKEGRKEREGGGYLWRRGNQKVGLC